MYPQTIITINCHQLKNDYPPPPILYTSLKSHQLSKVERKMQSNKTNIPPKTPPNNDNDIEGLP